MIDELELTDEVQQIYKELLICHLKARKNKRKTHDEHEFEVNLFENLLRIAVSIASFCYAPSPGIAFVTRKPVLREIFAAPYRDRIVHHYIFAHVIGYWERHFIHDSYSCRVGKGTLYGIRRVEKAIRVATQTHGGANAYVYKYDLTGYFMSLPRNALYVIAVRGLNRQFAGHRYCNEYRYLKYLWRKIIFNDPTLGVRLRGSLKNWDDLPRTKSLFCQPKGYGIVIGNLTSQLLSNIYLNDFDHYMSEWFGFDFYGRYVDDFMIVIDKAMRAKMPDIENKMRLFLLRKGLRINKRKTRRQCVNYGVEFLGVVIYPYRTVLGQRIKKNFHQAAIGYCEGRSDIDSLVSYAGMTVHHDCANLTLHNFEKAGIL